MLSILHVSDLHRSKEEPVDNDSLLAALLADRDRYVTATPKIPPPDAIVVSGDLIQGAQLNASGWQKSLEDQYKVAEHFLATLCNLFLDGDRSRVVLVPGNHDVCWNTSRLAMKKVPDEQYPSNLYDVLIKPDSIYRWSWSEQALFHIVDMALYKQRMSRYWDFIESFYRDVALPLPIDRERGFQLFEFCNRNVVVAAFDSIEGNDCFSFSGALLPGAVGRCAMVLRDFTRSYDLKIALWHHSIQGPPTRSDYMNVSQVQEMIGHGFQLGLHGHQHVGEIETQFVHLDQRRSMAVVSAGSLCAGAREMPRGVNRQYNLIVIEDDFKRGRVHVREMAEGGQFTLKNNGAFSEGFVEISWQPLLDMMGRQIDTKAANAKLAISKAEAALLDGKLHEVAGELRDVDLSSPSYARNLMIEALQKQEDWSKLSAFLENPGGIEEIVLLVSALIASNNLDDAETRLNAATELDAATHADLLKRLEAKRMLRQL
ncbi:MAG: hypothetical protein F4142_08275 [Nitrospira sp. SB0675_bin_23]|nr:hypothetical protein [Nitrospira sp. SB0667_bin_9]MYD30291.1 hypothetical protein [Nitrospira sp. SB0661_bin_20]MYH02553.1 hypothetical protein [Nitrospira sp. SB0675_bin_23]MYJ22667.1 hypothetical protein [Nitrospira sp. SB0673_bin_12]